MINKKMFLILVIVTGIVIAGTLIYISIKNIYDIFYRDNIVQENIENHVQSNELTEENSEDENININENAIKQDKVENSKDENKKEENKKTNPKEEVTQEEKDVKDQNKDLANKEMAIGLVRKKWGENDDTVYYFVEEQLSDDIFIISVRDQATTEDLSSYKVDINKKSVKEN